MYMIIRVGLIVNIAVPYIYLTGIPRSSAVILEFVLVEISSILSDAWVLSFATPPASSDTNEVVNLTNLNGDHIDRINSLFAVCEEAVLGKVLCTPVLNMKYIYSDINNWYREYCAIY